MKDVKSSGYRKGEFTYIQVEGFLTDPILIWLTTSTRPSCIYKTNKKQYKYSTTQGMVTNLRPQCVRNIHPRTGRALLALIFKG